MEQLTKKIYELLGINVKTINLIQVVSVSPKPIREAEILMSLNECSVNNLYAIDSEGDFLTKYKPSSCWESNPRNYWQLGKPLSEQSEETINFLKEQLL